MTGRYDFEMQESFKSCLYENVAKLGTNDIGVLSSGWV